MKILPQPRNMSGETCPLSLLALFLALFVHPGSFAPLPQGTTTPAPSGPVYLTPQNDRNGDANANTINFIEVGIGFGTFVMAILTFGAAFYHGRAYLLQSNLHHKEILEQHAQDHHTVPNISAPSDILQVWAQKYNPVYVFFPASFRRPVVHAPFHLRRAATWTSLHVDPDMNGSQSPAFPPPCRLDQSISLE
jgi:hypothetical protein